MMNTGEVCPEVESGVSDREVVQIDRLSSDQRALLQNYLRGAAIPFELSPTTIEVPPDRANDLHNVLTIVGDAAPIRRNRRATDRPAASADDADADGHEPILLQDEPAPNPIAWTQERLPGGRTIASFNRRLLGALIDWLIVTGASLAADPRDLWLIIVGLGAYTILATAFFGRTIGKMVVGTRVVRGVDFEVPGLGKAALRWVLVSWGELLALVMTTVPDAADVAVFVVLAVTYSPILWDRRGRGWHDRLADTIVIRARNSRPLAITRERRSGR